MGELAAESIRRMIETDVGSIHMDMNHAPEAPFFIVGSPRSGTTLLRFMIGRHPRIHIPGETGFIPFLRVPVDALLTRKQVRSVLLRIGYLHRNWKSMVIDSDAFYNALPAPRLRHVLDRLYAMRLAEQGEKRWGDKTPLYVQYMPYLSMLFPDAQFIHVIRDGRDAVVSAMEKWGSEKSYIDPYYLLKHWVRNVQAGREYGQAEGGDRYLEVRYEDLVTRPETVLRSICDFLGETFETVMLGESGSAVEAGGTGRALNPEGRVTAAHVGRWKDEMSVFEKKLADRIAGPTLERLGYTPAQLGGFTPSERLRFAYLATKFTLTDSARTLLYKLGILTLNRGARDRP